MKMKNNCRILKVSDCPFLRHPMFHSGYTSKSGPETWFHCSKHKKPIRHIKNCELAGDSTLQAEAWLDKL